MTLHLTIVKNNHYQICDSKSCRSLNYLGKKTLKALSGMSNDLINSM